MQSAEVADGYVRGRPRPGCKASDMMRDLLAWTMERHGWTLREFARRLGEDRSTLYRFLHGHEGGWPEGKIGYITSLCELLGLSPSELFELHPVNVRRDGNAQHLAALRVTSPDPRDLLERVERLEQQIVPAWPKPWPAKPPE